MRNPPPLLPNHELSPSDLRRIKRKRRICRATGHFYYCTAWDAATGHALLECRRCFPHKDSLLEGVLYDLLPRALDEDD